ncbi:IS21-like element helper ATPase IstB [Gelidibacter salicanalis]|uniref:IS21-like element helper ATPase IstB n=1 Tax=Gelidibacter salicanalis TaxID=291193 RepID=A0A934L094_9FLAO|nr:IS21-like element helper ATPase IstB [Gelidibacter salicanalis]MBJ7883060.1 IS21-like element helper ATPase IstB [Gelidibacter salicanalis]
MSTIEDQLTQLRLNGMHNSWKAMVETRQHHELSFGEGLEVLLQAEAEDRTHRRFERLKKGAQFRYQASVEELSLDSSRGLNKTQITELASGSYLKKGESILLTGATGCGKSFLASALGHQACSQGYKVLYYNTQKLMMKTKMTRIDGSFLKFFDKLAKANLLILDDFGLAHLDGKQQMDLMEIIEDRHGRSSTIIASQLPVGSWYDIIGEASIADAILDRLVHTSHRIELKGESLRKKL